MLDVRFVEGEVMKFLGSRSRLEMVESERYFSGEHDVLKRQREVIGTEGRVETVSNLPNNRIVDNQYRKLVVQKANYILGKTVAFFSENCEYVGAVKSLLDRRFNRLMKNVAEDSLKFGVGWLFVHYNDGELAFKRMNPCEIIAGWRDVGHTVLDYIIRVYDVVSYPNCDSFSQEILTFVEVFCDTGIYYYQLVKSKIIPVPPYHSHYFFVSSSEENACNIGYNWGKIPFVAFKYNREKPLLNCVRSLQDGLNVIESNFLNHMQEDQRNTILVLVNYDGENLGEFRKNLAEYGAVKVNTIDKAPGDVRSLQVDVNADNYRAIIELFKKAIIENGMGFDAKDDRLSGTPNQMNIMSMYSDIDLDANSMETEFQASFEELFWFIDNHFYNYSHDDFFDDDITVIFNRDILINESEAIEMCVKSQGIIADETVISNHPWVDDPSSELHKLSESIAKINDLY